MSNPVNPLSNFRSVNAIHVLIMADSMETADAMYDPGFQFERDNTNPEARYDIRSLPNSPERRFVILFDGRRDTDFSIQEISWETVLVPNHGKNRKDYVSTVETEGNMTIVEPYGVSFLEALVTSTAGLQVDPNSVVFVLKTIFVGHTEEGNVREISDVQPFTLKVIDLKAKMMAAKAEYAIKFMGMTNGTSKLPQISSIGNGLTLKLKEGETLASALQKLQAEIRNQYEIYYRKILEKADAKDALLQYLDRFIKVEYNINVDRAYEDTKYKVGTNIPHDQFVENGKGIFEIKFSNNASVESCIRSVIATCEQIEKDASTDQEGNAPKRYLPKILSAVSPARERKRYAVTYRVSKVEQIVQSSAEDFEPAPGDFIEFDYIYTGKNIDVVDMDIKMDMGLSFFYTGLTAKPTATTQAEIESENLEDAEPFSSDFIPFEKKTPLFLGATIIAPELQNRINPISAATFDNMLERQARLESVAATMTIVGNPRMLNDVSTRPSDIDSDTLEPIDAVQGTGTQNFLRTPSVVKVNIKYPKNKDFTNLQDFWYRGYYTILAIRNEFKNGTFLQTLDMISIPYAQDGGLATAPVATTPLPQSGRQGRRFISSTSDQKGVGGLDGTAVLGRDYEVKPGANISNLSIEIQSIIDDIVAVWKDNNAGVKPVITSGNDSRHKVGSLHYSNDAIDVRGNNLDPSNNYRLAKTLQAALQTRIGSDYDVLFEIYPSFTANNHFHIEYDPKRRSLAPESEETTGG